MTKASDNLFPGIIIRESADDGSDFTNPAADYRRLFVGEDGDIHLKDSSGTVTDFPAGGGGGGGEAPWRQEVTALLYSSHTNWNTLIAVASSGNKLLYVQSSGAQNDEIVFEGLSLNAGTYTIVAWVFKSNNHGIMSVQLDSVELTTFDLYNGSSSPDQRMANTGLSVASTDVYQLKLKMTSKNGSSSNYYGLVHSLAFIRTA